MVDGCRLSPKHLQLAALICFHIIICCLSLVYATNKEYGTPIDPPTYHLFYDPARLYSAAIAVAAYAFIALFFVFSRFSFGYFAGFYLYTMVLGYLWLNFFTDLKYDHVAAAISAALSAIAFLLPALLISSPFRQLYVLSAGTFDRLLTFILLFAAATIAVAAAYNFRLVSLGNIYEYRNNLESPTILNYLVSIVQSALLPFAFAGLVLGKAYLRAALVLLLLLLFYPITLSKLAFFAPFWLLAIALLARLVESRVAVILSLLGPILLGLALLLLLGEQAGLYFSTVNIRILAIPSLAMDVYNDFFSRHPHTYFCHVSFLKPLMDCPYQDQLSIVMSKAYGLGNFNASLFATEGIASLGPYLAPVSALACGGIMALGNRMSADLPARFILVSGAILPQVLLNVALSTALLTHGMAVLFLLWYITPRSIFEPREKALNGAGN